MEVEITCSSIEEKENLLNEFTEMIDHSLELFQLQRKNKLEFNTMGIAKVRKVSKLALPVSPINDLEDSIAMTARSVATSLIVVDQSSAMSSRRHSPPAQPKKSILRSVQEKEPETKMARSFSLRKVDSEISPKKASKGFSSESSFSPNHSPLISKKTKQLEGFPKKVISRSVSRESEERSIVGTERSSLTIERISKSELERTPSPVIPKKPKIILRSSSKIVAVSKQKDFIAEKADDLDKKLGNEVSHMPAEIVKFEEQTVEMASIENNQEKILEEQVLKELNGKEGNVEPLPPRTAPPIAPKKPNVKLLKKPLLKNSPTTVNEK